MKVALLAILLFCVFSVRGDHFWGIRVSPYQNFDRTFLMEFFHFDYPDFLNAEKLELFLNDKQTHDSRPNLDDSNGTFPFENGKIVWWKENFIIHPDSFSFKLKNSKCDFELSGSMIEIRENSLDLRLAGSMTLYYKNDWHCEFSTVYTFEIGQISVTGGAGGYVRVGDRPESAI